MIIGMVLGLLVGIVSMVIIFDPFSQYSMRTQIILSLIIVLFTTTLGGIGGNSVEEIMYSQHIESFESTKTLYETSINNDKLSGFERLEIVKMANEANVVLASDKVSVNAWWCIFINSNIKDKINTAQYIGKK